MNSKIRIKYLFLIISIVAFSFSCTSRNRTTRGDSKPAWTNITAGAYTVNGARVLRATGSSSDWGDVSTTRDAARNNTYANLSYYMKTYVKAIRTSYKKSHTDKEGNVDFERELEHISQTLTKYKFSGGKFIKQWKNPKDGTLYVLLEIKLEIIDAIIEKAVIENSKKMGVKPDLEAVRRRSAEAHKRLDDATDDLDF